MEITALDNSCEYGQPGIFRGHLRFENPRLANYKWEICEIRGRKPGPRLCISSGIHPNEVSAMEAAVRLQKLFDPEEIAGSVSIIPFINQPALFEYEDYVCPLDGKNIVQIFPGKKNGTFSEALCDSIMNEWSIDSACLIDMHGGGLRERVSKFTIYQDTDDAELNARGRDIAMCFDSEFVLALPKRFMETVGRTPTGFAKHGRIAVIPEAGANGLVKEDEVSFFVEGVLNVARTLGIINSSPSEFTRQRVPCKDYVWVYCPVDGDFHPDIESADRVSKGQRLGIFTDLFGNTLAEVTAPVDGYVLWRMTHPSIRKDSVILAIGVEESTPS